MRKKFLLAAAIIMIITLTACGSASGPDADTLVYGSKDYTRINPAMDEHCEINALIFDGLTDHDGSNEVVPRLARDWSYDDETFTYTFRLEENVKWHDGEPFTADDVRFTFEQIMDPENGSENAPNYEDVEEIKVIDDYTVSFRLKAPNAAFLDYMTMTILPEHLLKGENMQEADYFRSPVGTGPYKLDSWEEGQRIILKKNEEYFAGPANIGTIVFKIVADDNAAALQMESGDLTLTQVTPKAESGFENSDEYNVYEMKTSDYRGILYNFANEYWQKNADIIPAISYAIDKAAIVDSVILGKGEAAYGPLQRNKYNNEAVNHYDFSLENSEKVMKAAGCTRDEDGFWTRDGSRIGFTINASPDDQVRIDMAQLAAQQLREAGFDVKADVPSEGIDWGGQECCIIGWGSPFDADDHTYKVFGTDKGANYSCYSNALVDEYLTKARQTDDEGLRASYYDSFQEELADKPAYTFFCYIDAIYVADKSLKGISEDTVLGHHGVGIFWNVCDWTIEE